MDSLIEYCFLSLLDIFDGVTKSSVMVCLVGSCETKSQTNIVSIMRGISAHSPWDAHLIPNMIGFQCWVSCFEINNVSTTKNLFSKFSFAVS